MPDDTFTCSHCGKIHPVWERTVFDGQALCPDCFSEHTALCAHCGTRVWIFDNELIDGSYPPDTPAAIIYKASWPDEKICRCTVAALEKTAAENGIKKTALILVGKFLDSDFSLSKLYDPAFSTEYREAKA